MKRYKSLLLAAAFLPVAAGMSGQSLPPGEVAVRILSQSPASKGEELGIASLSQALTTESNLPDPEIEGEYLFAPGDEKNRWGAGISWGIEWPGVYSARKKDAAGKLSAAEAAATQARHQRLIQIKRLLLDYILAERQLTVLNGIEAANDSILLLSGKAGQHGELTRLDLNKLKLEQATLRSNRLSVINSRAAAAAALDVIYGDDCSSLLKEMRCDFPAITIPAALDDFSKSPAVTAAEKEAAASRNALGLADAESLPGFSIGYQHAFEDGLHFNGASLGISIPLFSSRNKKNAAKAAVEEAEFKASSARREAQLSVEGSIRQLKLIDMQITETAPVIEDSGNAALLLKAYSGGIITLIDYLNERNYFTNATLDLLALRHAAANILLDIETHLPENR